MIIMAVIIIAASRWIASWYLLSDLLLLADPSFKQKASNWVLLPSWTRDATIAASVVTVEALAYCLATVRSGHQLVPVLQINRGKKLISRPKVMIIDPDQEAYLNGRQQM